MSRERMTKFVPEEPSQIRRLKRAGRARRMRRVRRLLLAVVLMVALAFYAGYRTPQRAAARSMSRQEEQIPQAQQLQVPADVSGVSVSAAPDTDADAADAYSFTDEEFEGLASGVLDEIVRDGMT